MAAPPPKPPPAIVPAGFWALRTPLLPFDELLAWGAGMTAPGALADDPTLEAALAADRASLRARLRVAIARPEVLEALFIASPSLEESLPHWLEAPDSERGQKVERTLCRYFPRMAARCTPFGLFAGCSSGALGERTLLRVEARAHYRRHTRLDMDYVFTLAEMLARDPELRRMLVYSPNSSLYRAAGKLRYAEAHVAGRRSYNLVALDPSGILEQALAVAAPGVRPGALAEALVDAEAGIEMADAIGFVDELIDAQVIVPALLPGVTGREPIHQLIDGLAPPGGGDRAALAHERLVETRDWLATHDATPLGAEPAVYRQLAARLEALPAPIELSRLFQVDMVKPAAQATLGTAVVEEITRAIALLHPLAPRRRHEGLSRFREAFSARYEEREVPLCEALDEESGLGFEKSQAPSADASPLLAGLVFPPEPEEATVRWNAWMRLALRKLEEALTTGAREVTLAAKELEPLAVDTPHPLPDSFAVVATLFARGQAALDAGDYRLLFGGVAGPSAANLLGRFCHGDDVLTRHVRAALRAEEVLEPDAVFAEIVHLPEGRIGNILTRPALRAHEIPFLCASGVAKERQIPVTDLLVSVRGGGLMLRSARLGKRVVPRLTTAHNTDSPFNLGVYRFLCAFQAAHALGLGWGWGPLESASFLPRVALGKLVLAEARWNLDRATLEALGRTRGAARFRAVQKLRDSRRMPRFVAVADGDNELPVDLDNALAVDTCVHLLKDRPTATLVELFPEDDGELCASGPEGRFTHELVVPFGNRRPVTSLPLEPALVASERCFMPGSSWLYARLYAGASTVDAVLAEVVRPVVDAQLASGAAAGWFFLRYDDGGVHLRVRFTGAPERLQGEVLPALERAIAPLVADGRIWRMQLDTYEREVERYGGPEAVLLAERFFHADSEAVLAIVETLEGDAGSDARWRLALLGMDLTLAGLGLDDAGKLEVVRQARQEFGAEFRVDVGFERQLGDRFRSERKRLEALLAGAPGELDAGRELLARRDPQLGEIGRELRALAAAGRLGMPLPVLLMSYLHMHANRLLEAATRAQELVIYDFLQRLYESRLARARKGAASK